jgi:hypothetical protein
MRASAPIPQDRYPWRPVGATESQPILGKSAIQSGPERYRTVWSTEVCSHDPSIPVRTDSRSLAPSETPQLAGFYRLCGSCLPPASTFLCASWRRLPAPRRPIRQGAARGLRRRLVAKIRKAAEVADLSAWTPGQLEQDRELIEDGGVVPMSRPDVFRTGNKDGEAR